MSVDARPNTKELPEAPSVLFVLMGSLGDIVRALPLLSLLERHRPRARITWAIDERWRAVGEAHSAVDRLVVFPRERTPAAVARFARELRTATYDIALDLQRILKSGVCSLASRAPRRVGFNRADTKEFNHLFNNEWIRPGLPRESKLRIYLAFAEHLGLPVPDTLEFGLDRFAHARHLPSALHGLTHGFVGVVMGSSWPAKDWTVEGYIDLVGRIARESSRTAVLLGGEGQRGIADRVAAAVPWAHAVNLAGRTTLPELGATLAAAAAAVGPDTGAGHLAAALGTPYVTLFGPTDPSIVVPYHCESFAVRSPADCEPCRRRVCRRREGSCMKAITADAVWRTLGPLAADGRRPALPVAPPASA